MISVTRKTKYTSIVEMPEEKFKQIKNDLESKNWPTRRAGEKEADKLVNVNDWQDDDLDSVDEFEPFV